LLNGVSTDICAIPDELFQFVRRDMALCVKKPETRPVGYFKDAWLRFKNNKASLAAAVVIAAIVFLGVCAPLATRYKISDADGVYAKARPCNPLFASLGIGFWDGTGKKVLNDKYKIYLAGIGIGAEFRDGNAVSWAEGAASPWCPIASEARNTKRTVCATGTAASTPTSWSASNILRLLRPNMSP
jgi:oligopeptide transport system permease protein